MERRLPTGRPALLAFTAGARGRWRLRTTPVGAVTPGRAGLRAERSRVTCGSEPGPRLRQDATEDPLHLVEVLLRADERRSELDDGVATVVGPADEARVEQGGGQEAAQ